MYYEDNSRVGLIRIKFDEAAIKPTEAFCMPVKFIDDKLEGLLLVPTGDRPMEFERVGHFSSDDVETHEKLLREKNDSRIIFTII